VSGGWRFTAADGNIGEVFEAPAMRFTPAPKACLTQHSGASLAYITRRPSGLRRFAKTRARQDDLNGGSVSRLIATA